MMDGFPARIWQVPDKVIVNALNARLGEADHLTKAETSAF